MRVAARHGRVRCTAGWVGGRWRDERLGGASGDPEFSGRRCACLGGRAEPTRQRRRESRVASVLRRPPRATRCRHRGGRPSPSPRAAVRRGTGSWPQATTPWSKATSSPPSEATQRPVRPVRRARRPSVLRAFGSLAPMSRSTTEPRRGTHRSRRLRRSSCASRRKRRRSVLPSSSSGARAFCSATPPVRSTRSNAAWSCCRTSPRRTRSSGSPGWPRATPTRPYASSLGRWSSIRAAAARHGNLGTALLMTGRTKEAIVQYELHARIDDGDARAHSDLGTALLATSDLERSLSELARATSLEPRRASFHSNLGYALQQAGRFDRAVAEYREAIALDPTLASAWINLATILAQESEDSPRGARGARARGRGITGRSAREGQPRRARRTRQGSRAAIERTAGSDRRKPGAEISVQPVNAPGAGPEGTSPVNPFRSVARGPCLTSANAIP